MRPIRAGSLAGILWIVTAGVLGLDALALLSLGLGAAIILAAFAAATMILGVSMAMGGRGKWSATSLAASVALVFLAASSFLRAGADSRAANGAVLVAAVSIVLFTVIDLRASPQRR